ncbi:hypothetical protein A2U01_0068316, partial [Trifolium medium]|nr:hypothetical protein [Trifolium medium]
KMEYPKESTVAKEPTVATEVAVRIHQFDHPYLSSGRRRCCGRISDVGVVVLATSVAGVEQESRAAHWRIVDSSSSNRDLA